MFTVNFLANQAITEEEINEIGYNLSNTVYTSFENNTPYGINDFNAITAHMMNKGVKRNYKNECALSLADTNVHIDSGLAFFENGATITIDDDGIDLTLEDSTEKQYVYLFFNSTINIGGARCTVEYPSGDFVMLGSIKNGVLTQDRTFASINAEFNLPNKEITITLNGVPGEYHGIGNWAYTTEGLVQKHYGIRWTTDINVTSYKRAVFESAKDVTPTNSANKIFVIGGCYDIANNELEFFGAADNGECFTTVNQHNYFSINIVDGKLQITYLNYYGMEEYPLYVTLYGGAEE